MSTREPFDHERVVRETEIHNQPTDVIRTSEVVREVPVQPVHPTAAHYEDAVVVERPAYDYSADAVREDVAIDHVVERRAMLDRISSIIWFATGLLEVALGMRIVFRLLEANTTSGFVSFIYNFTDPFVAPFNGIFNDPTSDGAVLDSGALVAMVIYALAVWALVRLMWLLFDRAETGASRTVRHVHSDRI
jgi:hypothetical protein